MMVVRVLLIGLAAYAAVGVVVGSVFVLTGVSGAVGGARVPLRVRVVLLPGAMGVWPLLLGAWLSSRRASAGSGAA